MSGRLKKWPKPASNRVPLVVTAAEIPERCPDCGALLQGRTIDGDVSCLCGTVIYIRAEQRPSERPHLRKAMVV